MKRIEHRPEASWLAYLHGFLGAGEDWRDIVTRLGASYNHLLIDLPGHGDSPCGDNRLDNFRRVSEQVAQAVQSTGIRACTILGYSMGGRIALNCLMTFPDLFGVGVIISGSPGLESEFEQASRVDSDRRLAERLRTAPLAAFIHDWYSAPLFASLAQRPELKATLLASRLKNDPHRLAWALVHLGVGSQPSHWNDLGSLKQPLLFVAGDADHKYTGIMRRMASLCRRARLCIVEGCGHMPHLEAPEQFTEELRQFLQSHAEELT